MTTEIHEGPLEASRTWNRSGEAVLARKAPPRRRRRVWFEEILGWVLVPVIIFRLLLAADIGLNAVGTSPAAIMEGIDAIISSL